MEIGGIAKFRLDDATVFVRTMASAVDKTIFEALKEKAVRELVEGGKPDLSKDLASLFVCGWSGFTCGGEPAPYSWAVLERALPDEAVSALAKFVAQNVDILKP